MKGEHVHTHNVEVNRVDLVHSFCVDNGWKNRMKPNGPSHFEGYARGNGKSGTRNYIGVLTTVNCSATVARFIASAFTEEKLGAYPNVDGVVSLVHGTGCGMAGSGEGMDNLTRLLCGYASHANFGGILLVGLGCESVQLKNIVEALGEGNKSTFQYFNIQDTGGTRSTVEHGIAIVESMLGEVNQISREKIPTSELIMALQCGGSDSYSGITANPALGYASDILIAHGGTSILAETPEIFGAEHLLTRRSCNRKVAEKLLDRIVWWEDYTKRNYGEMNNNPSPGNKAGGLTTILEKSLGAVAKSGNAPLIDVVLYGEQIKQKGFHFMDSPGYDPASITGQVASGASVVCFTTGRGSVFGCKPVPSIKLATNTEMFNRLSDDMDINCGSIVDGVASVSEMGEIIYEYVVGIASGKLSKSEELGFGDAEFVPWQIGAVM